MDFSNETVATPSSKLSIGRRALTATFSSSYGYFGGGYAPPAVPRVNRSTIDRLDFSTETVTTPSPKLSQSKSYLAATSSSSYGYFGGGYGPTAGISTIDRLDFSTETVTTPTPKLSTAKTQLSALSNSN